MRKRVPGVAALASLVVVGLAVTGCRSRSTEAVPVAWQRLEFSRPQMGVPFRIVVYAANEAAAQAAVEAAYERIRRLNAIFSDYDPDSEVSRLCQTTPPHQAVQVSPELWFLLERSQALASVTEGAFDVTIGPVVNLWRRARRRGELPATNLLAEARARVGWRELHLDPATRSVTLGLPDMRLDFGAIAKGYAIDEALQVLRERGFPRALVAAAGDVAVGEAPPDQAGWRIEIGGSDLDLAPAPRTLWLKHVAIATSGDAFQRLDFGGQRYSHIVDPGTGVGLTDHSLVTVLAADGTTADSLSTAVSVLGPTRGLALVEATPGAAALIVRAPEQHLEVHESRRLRHWFQASGEPGRASQP